MNNFQFKKVIKFAVLIYSVSFLIINWSDVSWIFNYREVSGMISDFFNPYPSIDATALSRYFQNATSQPLAMVPNLKTAHTDKKNTLEIPKISIEAPIVFSSSASKDSLENDLELGVTYYPGSVYPGQIGQIVVLGHSAPRGWPKTRYDWIFTDLDKLAPGDLILINMDKRQYKYAVKNANVVQRGADVSAGLPAIDSNILTLISCWPPGEDFQRIVVQAELVVG